MRAKVILIAFVVALAVLVPAIYIRFKPASPESPVAQQTAVAPVDNTAPASAGASPILKRVAQGRSQEDQLPTRSFQFATDPIEVKAQLTDLGMSGDPANLKVILSQLENPNPEIRQAALSSTIDFGSKDAIPTLQSEMNWATDPEEKIEIKKAIDFLQLPSFGSGGDVTQQSSDPSAPATN